MEKCKRYLKKAREIEKIRGLQKEDMLVDADWKYQVHDLCYDRMNVASELLIEQLHSRFGLYKYFNILDKYSIELETDECLYPLLEEKVKFYDIFKRSGLNEAEKYAKDIIHDRKPELLKPKKLTGGFIVNRKEYEDDLYHLCNYIDEHGKCVNVDQELLTVEDDIKVELGEKFEEKIASMHQYNIIRLFFLNHTIEAHCGEEQIKKYTDLHDYAVKHSKTVRKIQADINTINECTKNTLEKNQLLYRGGSVNEIFKLERYNGKTGYHKRGVMSMKGKDFTSTSIFPNVALCFLKNYPIGNDVILLEYNVSRMPESDVKAVQYDLRGMCMQYKNSCKKERFWPLEKFGGYYDPCHIHQAEVHLKKGSIPVISRAWINPNLNKTKKCRVDRILTKLYPDVKIYSDECIRGSDSSISYQNNLIKME